MTTRNLLERIAQAAEEKWEELNLSNLGLRELPKEIAQLQNLTQLNLINNKLSALPPEIAQLQNLTQLYLSHNSLSALPPEITQLQNLTQLDLRSNGLSALPPEIAQLQNLTLLVLWDNQFSTLPPEIAQLQNLTQLDLMNNGFSALPPEIAQLQNLTLLDLRDNDLSALPPEIAQLQNLTQLYLGFNGLSVLPPEIAQLQNLTQLNLANTGLSALPPEIAQLQNLTQFDLSSNGLSALPPEIAQLQNLTQLYLSGNGFSALPPEIAQLQNLAILDLSRNCLNALPLELLQIPALREAPVGHHIGRAWIAFDGNPLGDYPPEIRDQGQAGIWDYLKERAAGCERQWISKLLAVGEGGVGKTSLLRALRGEDFVQGLETTHGIAVDALRLPHPSKQGVEMVLNAWDFGGQDIYHATHQFFLSNRSLFLLAWNARLGFEQGRLYYWLDTIKALAPASPILLIATHTDEREASLPWENLREAYPQIAGTCDISSKSGAGISELFDKIAAVAAELPLMGEVWPSTWLDATRNLRAAAEKHISPQDLYDIMGEHGMAESSRPVLARWLHELGELLYFQESDELNDLVILKPQWVTEYISKVLESEDVIEHQGVFTRVCMNSLWRELTPSMREHFLKLMERFDLSYRTLDDKDKSLVVERLSLDPPDYRSRWEELLQRPGCREISLRFDLGSLQPGIPTWFIARQHRFTLRTHWRYGALFGDQRDNPQHLALVRAYPHERAVELSVRGPYPQNFFALLKDGLEYTLERFPGLDIERRVPCPGHGGDACTHYFAYEQLIKRLGKKDVIECPEAIEDVSVTAMLYGWEFRTEPAVLKRLDALEENLGGKIFESKDALAENLGDKISESEKKMLGELAGLRELNQRQFLQQFSAEQSKVDAYCPNVFSVRPAGGGTLNALRGGQRLELQLYCQEPGCWHPPADKDGKPAGCYEIKEPAKWLKAMAPYLSKFAKVFKYARLAGAGLNWFDEDLYKQVDEDIKLIEQLSSQLAESKDLERPGESEMQEAEGESLRVLRRFLDKQPDKPEWGGLRRTLTPEGHWLWLCDAHRKTYQD
ncbi:MAG: GTPase [Gammaproteobacteria bacterium]|nr:GTPase [Gammaproteobacteria bacterium]